MKEKLLSLLLVVCLLFGVAPAIQVQAAPGADQDIIILYTNDVHCSVDDNIGYAGLALYKSELEQQTPYVTLVDAGDAIQGAPIGTLSEGAYLIDIMNQVGYDVAVPGNHEFDYGMSRFLELSKKMECGYYSCNFVKTATGETVFEPYKMITYGDIDVAYVGVCTPESFTKSTPAYFQDKNGNYLYSFCEDESGQRLYQQVQNAVNAAREAGAEYVIAVAHVGENDVTPRWSSPQIIANTAGIDAWIDGHSHETTPVKKVKNQQGKEVVLTQTGTKLKNIGRLTIKTDGTIEAGLASEVPSLNYETVYTVQNGDTLARIAKRELGSYDRWNEIFERNKEVLSNANTLVVGQQIIIPQGASVNEDGKAIDYATDQYIKKIQSQYEESLKTVLGRTSYELTVNRPDGSRKVRSGETNLGDLSADAYRVMLGADIGFANGGGIRASIKPGNITYKDTLTVFPFGNMGCVVQATGQQVKDALEMASRNYPVENGGFLQVSGLTYTIDSSVPSSVKTDEKGNFIGVTGAYRVTDIMVGGEPIDLAKTYTVASHNYMLKSGGDGMTMFASCPILKDEVMVDVDILSGYINSLGGSVPADYAAVEGQGRITIR